VTGAITPTSTFGESQLRLFRPMRFELTYTAAMHVSAQRAYLFVATAETNVEVTLCGTNYDATLKILKADFKVIASLDDSLNCGIAPYFHGILSAVSA
jgi:hypothetical protein